MQRRISRFLIIALTAGIVFGTVSKTLASLQTGDIVRIGNGPGSPGGIFYLQDASGTKIIDSFCVQLEEYIAFNKTYQVADIATTTAGVGSKPLTSFAAWLYDRFLNGIEGSGPALTSFDFSNAYGQSDLTAARTQANQLQLAVWIAMGYTPAEIGGVSGGWYDAYDGALSTWQDAYDSDVGNGDWSATGTGDIYVVNLLGKDGSGNYTVNAQDQLIRVPSSEVGTVPEPLSVVIWSLLGLTSAGVCRIRRSRATCLVSQ